MAGAADAAIPVYTWAVKAVAAGLAGVGLARVLLLWRGKEAHPTGAAWLGALLAFGCCSAGLGAAQEGLGMPESGAVWVAMLVFMAAAGWAATTAGAWCIATRLESDGRGRRLVRCAGYGGLAFFAACTAAIVKSPTFDIASVAAGPGGVMLVAGAAVARAWTLFLGALAAPLGYGVALALASIPVTLPTWLSYDGVFHTGLAVSYLLLGEGSTRFLRRARKPDRAAAYDSLEAALILSPRTA